MQLPLQDFTGLVKTQAAAVAGSAAQLIDLSVGSVLRAVLEANACVGLWIQWLIVQVLATTRAGTSAGADLDSWMSDFGLARLAAVPAQGIATFSRVTAGLATVIPVGALVRTGVGVSSIDFIVRADAGHPAWTGNAYTLAAAASAIDVPVVALVSGGAGNVRPGQISILGIAIAGVDGVTNTAPLAGGLDAEGDVALRVRFSRFIDSRSRATEQAVAYALASVQQGLSYTIQERLDPSGAFRPGFFTVTVDDGSGSPPASLLAALSAAVEAVRPIGGAFSVRAPSVIFANVVMHVTASAPAIAKVSAAVGTYLGQLPIGGWLVLSRLTQLAHDADPSVASVYGVTINGVGTDLQVPASGLIRAGTVQVTA